MERISLKLRIKLIGIFALITICLFWHLGINQFSEGGKVFYGLLTICAVPAVLLLIFGKLSNNEIKGISK